MGSSESLGTTPATSLDQLRAENDRLRARVRALEHTERDLRKAQADLIALLENTDDMVLFSDERGVPVIFNTNYARAMKELMGLEMTPGMQPHTLLEDPEERAVWDGWHRRVLAGERFRVEFPFEHAGEVLTFEVSFNPAFDGERVVGFSEYTRDITARKHLERQLESERQQSVDDYAILFEKMLDGFAVHEMVLDESGNGTNYRFLAVNPAFEEQTGLVGSEIVGRTVREVIPNIESFWIETYGEVARTGVPIRFENYSEPLDRYYEVHAYRPRPDQFACVFQDITARKKLELEQARAERLRSVGVLAGGIAHDFNNILSSLLTSIELAKREVEAHTTADRMLEEAQRACQRASSLTQQLLTFARGSEPIRSPRHLPKPLREWVAFALRGSNVSTRIALADDLWAVQIDAAQISQVIHNIVVNADHAMPDGGKLVIRVENHTLNEGDVATGEALGAPAGRYVRVEISDEGVGIPQTLLSRIFDPYFTTKQAGSGLGLASAYAIMENHRGAVAVSSTVGVGTTFTLLLPASVDQPVVEDSQAIDFPTGTGRVLVMDDDEQLRTLAQNVLCAAGYEVDTAADGREAIRCYRLALEEARPYAAVVLDVTIPGGMGGVETIARLCEIDPRVRAIVSSGYSTDSVMANFEEYGFCGVVAKPYRIRELAAAVGRAITVPEDRSPSAG